MNPRFQKSEKDMSPWSIVSWKEGNFKIVYTQNCQITTEEEKKDKRVFRFRRRGAETSKSKAIEKEIDEYMKASFPNFKSNILKFWYEYAKVYPNIAKLAKKYLAVPATQSQFEF